MTATFLDLWLEALFHCQLAILFYKILAKTLTQLMAIGYTVALLYQVEFGLGRHEDTLNRNQRDTFGKVE